MLIRAGIPCLSFLSLTVTLVIHMEKIKLLWSSCCIKLHAQFDLGVCMCVCVLQVALCFSPVGNKLRVRSRKFPAVVNCTAIDWFHEWPQEALESVSFRFLQEVENIEVRTAHTLNIHTGMKPPTKIMFTLWKYNFKCQAPWHSECDINLKIRPEALKIKFRAWAWGNIAFQLNLHSHLLLM